MPHVTIEYSANLEQRLDIAALCATALEAAASTGVLELGATRVRAVRCDHYSIADRLRDNAFVDVSLRIGRGRSAEAKAATGKALCVALRALLSRKRLVFGRRVCGRCDSGSGCFF